jgi:alkylation response protein AidB-like acyl-CoA dehydrogenase
VQFELDEAGAAVVETAASVLALEQDPDASWKALGAAGLLALSVPSRLGGEGLGVLPTMTLLTEVGRRAVTLPALATLALGVLPVVRWGSVEQQDALLAGSPVLTAGVHEPRSPFPTAPATICSSSLQVSGIKVGVPYADRARRLLTPVSLAGGTAVALVDPAGPGVSLHPTPSSAGGPEWTAVLSSAPATLLGGGAQAVADLYRLAIAGTCAVGDGALSGALAITTAHVGTREQFGRRLASFQAVAQQIADVWIAARTVHLATLAACWRLDASPDASSDVDVAAYWLARHAPAALRTCHHLHGGLGLDVTYPMHRYSSLVKDLIRFLGGAEIRLASLGAYVGDA